MEKNAIIIDPANNIKTLEKFIDDKKVLAILLTHGHYDHFKSLRELLKKYDTKIYLHKEAYKKINDVNASFANAFGCNSLTTIEEKQCVFVNESNLIKLDEFEIKVKQKTRAYIIMYISNRKIKYKKKCASWTELC